MNEFDKHSKRLNIKMGNWKRNFQNFQNPMILKDLLVVNFKYVKETIKKNQIEDYKVKILENQSEFNNFTKIQYRILRKEH